MPDNRVNKVVLDSAQRVWCATEYGVAMFDGVTWTVYNSLNSGLTDNYIRSIAFDATGRLWVGTLSSGIFIYDGITWEHIHTGNSGLSDDCIKDIQFDEAGHWWLATTGGLNYYDSTSWTVWNAFNSAFFTNNVSFIRFKGNEKHCGTVNGGLHILDSLNNITNYNTFNSGIHDNTLPDGEWDTGGALWMATPAAGVMVHYNGNTWQWYYTGTSNISTNSLNSICMYGNKVYFTSLDSGLVIYNGSSFNTWHMGNTGIPENYLLDVAHDSLGNIWLGSYASGLIKVVESTLSVGAKKSGNRWQLMQNVLRPYEWLLIKGPVANHCFIYDASGRFITNQKLENNQLNLGGLSAGIYTLLITDGENEQAFRFSISN